MLSACTAPLAALLVALVAGSARADEATPAACRPPGADAKKIGAFLAARCYADWPRDRLAIRATGPSQGSGSPHGKVRVYYSPAVYEWLKAGRPKSGIPDGGMIYKEMFEWKSEKLTGGAYMLKQRGVSFDGWYWGGFGVHSGNAWGAWR